MSTTPSTLPTTPTAGPPTTGSSTAKVYQVDAAFGSHKTGPWKTIATGWYEPSNGYWSSTYVVKPAAQLVFTGTEYWARDTITGLHVSTGPAAALAFQDGRPNVWEAPGVLVAQAWFHPNPLLGGHAGLHESRGPNGELILLTAFGSGSDTSNAPIYLRVVVHAPVPLAQAGDVFPAPSGTPSDIAQFVNPGTADPSGLHAYWFGSEIDGKTARVVYENWESKTIANTEDGPPTPSEYEIYYREAAAPLEGKYKTYEMQYPGATGLPMLTDLNVTNYQLAFMNGLIESADQQGWHPATLADGEHAQVTVYNNFGFVKTATTMIQFQAPFATTAQSQYTQSTNFTSPSECRRLMALVPSMLPVGYAGAAQQGSVETTFCGG